MNLLELIEDGLSKVNIEYISHPDFSIDDYRGMCIQYLLSVLLGQLGEAGDCGLYSHSQEVGYIGWISIGECTLFFAPTKIIVLCGDERSRMEDNNLSPIGNI